ncbi:MAG: molecular chaperone HtpG, partial [Bacteroidales bacterium]
KYYTLEEYQTAIKDNQTDKDGKLVFLYASNKEDQYTYIQNAKEKGYDVLLMDGYLDTPFVNFLEQKNPDNRYVRVDADVVEKLIPKAQAKESHLEAAEKEDLNAIFKAQLPKEGGMYMVQFEALGEESEPVVITRSEFMRRMKDMAAMNPEMSFYGAMGDQFNVVVNSDHKLIHQILNDEKQKLEAKVQPIQLQIKEQEDLKIEINNLNKEVKPEDIPSVDKDRIADLDKKITAFKEEKNILFAEYGKENPLIGQMIDLALLANGLLKGEALHTFVKRSVNLL